MHGCNVDTKPITCALSIHAYGCKRAVLHTKVITETPTHQGSRPPDGYAPQLFEVTVSRETQAEGAADTPSPNN